MTVEKINAIGDGIDRGKTKFFKATLSITKSLWADQQANPPLRSENIARDTVQCSYINRSR